ncbi:MAG: BMP family ABC transporter substrate-binding protein [Methyloceanibacter sp.]|uniref:BMP family ABC transporter substrate-binding protein n=1 Tax=Methyloceanibacter sp. TaxID=1965321 RepID=UPI003D6D37B4
MSRWALTRRRAIEGAGLLGASALISGLLPMRSAHAADLVVGLIFIGPRDDWSWNQSFAEAAEAISALPKVKIVEAGYLPESTDYSSGKDSPEADAYARELERLISPDGAGLVISTSFGNDPVLDGVATKNPAVVFRHATVAASDKDPMNLGGLNALINQGHYVNGVAAGLCTKTNKLGFIAGLPEGAVLVNINSFLLGSRKTSPDTTVQVIFTGGWENDEIETAATNKLIDAGCDVITCHLDSPKVVIETAETRGAKICGHAVDQAPLAPKGYITGAEFTWTPMFEMFVDMMQKGEALPPFVIGGYDKGYVQSSPFGAGANPAAIKAAKSAIQAMKDETPIFVGPIKDNTGRLVVPAGTTYGPYAPELFQTNYLIEGVIGSIA